MNNAIKVTVLITLTSLPSWAQSEPCTAKQIKQEHAFFLEKYQSGDYQGASELLKPLFNQCNSSLQTRESNRAALHNAYFWALSDYLLALKKSEDYPSCIETGIAYLESYPAIYDEPKSAAVNAALFNLESCQQARDKQFAAYSQQSCDITGYQDSATKAPNSWGQNGSCVQLYKGSVSSQNLDGYESMQYSNIDKPYLTLIIEVNGQPATQKIEFADGFLGQKQYTAPTNIQLGGDDNQRLIRVKGGSNYLWPGTAAFYLDAVYQIKPSGQAYLVEEVVMAKR